jgi:hypothetical protein
VTAGKISDPLEARMTLKFRKLAVSPEVLSQTVGDEAVLLDLRREEYFSLNAVGRRVWELLQENSDVDVIRERLLEEYDVAVEALDKDLNDLFTRLLAAGLVRESVGAPT